MREFTVDLTGQDLVHKTRQDLYRNVSPKGVLQKKNLPFCVSAVLSTVEGALVGYF